MKSATTEGPRAHEDTELEEVMNVNIEGAKLTVAALKLTISSRKPQEKSETPQRRAGLPSLPCSSHPGEPRST